VLLQLDAFQVISLNQIQVDAPFDLLISDMAPNTTGNKTVDQFGSINLVEKVFEILPIFLKVGGSLVIKVFESNDAQVFLKKELRRFEEFHYLKPKSTREQSKEFFVIAKFLKA
jgi:23S rRNA (uridine2552-2'-O)-methyltransferase